MCKLSREDNAKGDIRLDTKEATLAGDDVLVPGDPEASFILDHHTTLDDELFMPPIKNEEKDYPLLMQRKLFSSSGFGWCGVAGRSCP